MEILEIEVGPDGSHIARNGIEVDATLLTSTDPMIDELFNAYTKDESSVVIEHQFINEAFQPGLVVRYNNALYAYTIQTAQEWKNKRDGN